MIGEPCDKCPKEIDPNKSGGANNPATIEEVVITAYRAITSVDWNKTMQYIAPFHKASAEDIALSDAKYGKCGPSDIGCDFNKLWRQTKDLPAYFASVPENLINGISSIAESEDAEEIIISSVILAVSLKRGKIGNVAKMGVGKTTSGWVVSKVFNSLDSAIQGKIKNAINKGIVAPTGQQGIIRLTATEAAQTGYQYKLKILGKGGDIRIYGNPNANGHIVFEKVMGH